MSFAAGALLRGLPRLSRCVLLQQRRAAWQAPSAWTPRSRTFDVWRRLDSNSDAVLYSLLGANVGVWALWNSDAVAKKTMWRHFTVSRDGLAAGRWHTLVTSAFSQSDGWHLTGNVVSLYFFGREIGRLFGGARLLGLYLAGALGCSIAHVAFAQPLLPHQRRLPEWARPPAPAALGASGAVNAIVVLDTLLFPTRIIYVNLILPVPALLLGGFVLARDMIGARAGSDGVAHAGHLGGAAVGLAAWAWLILKRRRF